MVTTAVVSYGLGVMVLYKALGSIPIRLKIPSSLRLTLGKVNLATLKYCNLAGVHYYIVPRTAKIRYYRMKIYQSEELFYTAKIPSKL